MTEIKFIEIIQEPSYWVEEVNNLMYDAMVNYMDKHQLNKTEFAAYLNITKGRLSQILNSGEINFSLEKLFSIALKLGKIPNIKFEDAAVYIHELENAHKKQYSMTPKRASAQLASDVQNTMPKKSKEVSKKTDSKSPRQTQN